MSMSRERSGPGPVPDRWMHCPRKAQDLIIQKFMAFKTPLSSNFDSQVPPESRFPPKMLFNLCKSKKVKFGLWIDLTNTSRFYDKEEVESESCSYIKLQCRGHGECPSIEQTDTFINVVENFIRKRPLEAIAVHCTHGFNRTGFLIVSYLVKKEDFDLESAIEEFARVRPPGIYKSDYIEELYRRYDSSVETIPPAPDRPDWESEDDNTTASTSSTNNLKKKNSPKFMEGVPGVEIFTQQPKAFHLQQKVREMCGWKKKGFPGSQPVTLGFNNLKLLGEKPYMVSWKADGTRYLMLIDKENEVYFFDRDNTVFKVKGLKFPCRRNLDDHLRDTLLDGEMVIDKVEEVPIPRFLAYDIIKFCGKEVGQMPFKPNRQHCLEHEIIKPRSEAMEAGKINKANEPFSVRMKQFWDVTQAENLLGEKFAAQLCHEPDGLIFQPELEPYVPGRCDTVLKWKPIELNSVDFRMKIIEKRGMGMVPKKVITLYVGQLDAPFAEMKYQKKLKDYDGKIVECKFENNKWVFMRERTDKSFPNSYDTAFSVCQSIKNPVTKDILLDFIRKVQDDRDFAKPPPKRIRR